MGWDDGPQVPDGAGRDDDASEATLRERHRRRSLILAFVIIDVLVIAGVLIFVMAR